jgi:hypothetical protein
MVVQRIQKRIAKLAVCAIIALTLMLPASNVPVAAQATPLPLYALPKVLLLGYYNAINLRDYQAAYNLWVTPRQTFQDFAGGFNDTLRVEPYFSDLQPSNPSSVESGRVPAVLLAYHTDGKINAFYGCFWVSNQIPGLTGYRIVGADLRVLSDRQFPDTTTMEQYLAINCFTMTIPTPTPARFVNPPTDRARPVITAYYDAINRRDYASAYTMWLRPLPGPRPNGAPALDYRLPYDQFVTGYAKTAYVNIYAGEYNETGASAGHSYLNGALPMVLIGQHTDGSVDSYYGCYVMGWLPNGTLGIVSGKFLPFTRGDVPDGRAILRVLQTDCFSLGLDT